MTVSPGFSSAKKTARFADAPEGQWYSAAVEWCAEHGIVTGYTGTGLFGPNDELTREQFAAMIYRCCSLVKGLPTEKKGDISGFSDKDSISEWARDGVEYCVAWGIISGYADGSNRFGPRDTATRCHLGKMIAAADYMLYTI